MKNKELFETIKDRYEHLIKAGAYLPGEPLPSLRKVALDLGVNPNTVEKSFRLLAEEGLIEIIPKKGAFVKSFMDTSEEDPFSGLKTIVKQLKQTHDTEKIIKVVNDTLAEGNND